MTTVDDADSRTFEAVILLYLGCSKLPDGDLAEGEARRILELARVHTEDPADTYSEQVVGQVAMAFSTLPDDEARLAKVVDAAEHVGRTLTESSKRRIVEELESIAAADGTTSSAERAFVDAVARTFGLERPKG